MSHQARKRHGWILNQSFLPKWRSQSEKATQCMIPTIWHSGKSKTIQLVKRGVIAKGSEGEGRREEQWTGEAQGSLRVSQFSRSVLSASLRPHGLQPGFPIDHQLLEFAQIHVHPIGFLRTVKVFYVIWSCNMEVKHYVRICQNPWNFTAFKVI